MSNSKRNYSTNIKKIASTIILTCTLSIAAQAAIVTKAKTVIKAEHYGLANSLYDDNTDMSYDPAQVSTLGAAFSAEYVDEGGSGMDAYLSGAIGGFKANGAWHSSDKSLTGMPVKISDLTDSYRIQWKPVQTNALDADDKWWATINVIFDDGAENAEPVATSRDYDVVIQMHRYTQDELADVAKEDKKSYWWFARNTDNSIHPFVVNVDGEYYEWAVRYKFFRDSDHKNDKVHIKFIPVDNTHIPDYLDTPLKKWVDASKQYLQYVDLPTEEKALADKNVALSGLWIKSIAAGYEVYTGSSTLANEYFRTVTDTTAPSAPDRLIATENNGEILLDWFEHADDAFEKYTLYRSINNGDYIVLVDDLRTNSFIDTAVNAEIEYAYYVTASDRSLNESPASNIFALSTITDSGETGSETGGATGDESGSATGDEPVDEPVDESGGGVAVEMFVILFILKLYRVIGIQRGSQK